MTISTLGYALLALLVRKPSTGYELSHRLDRPIGYFWTAQHSQIHGELGKLSAADAVSWTALPGPGPHDKKVYSITETGRRHLADWVIEPPKLEPARSEMLLKAYAMWTADPVRARQLVLAQLAMHQSQLADYEVMWRTVTDAHPGGVPPRTHPDFGNYLTLRYGIGQKRHDVQWAQWVLSTLTDASVPAPPEAE